MPTTSTPESAIKTVTFGQWFRKVVALGVKLGYQPHQFSVEDWQDYYDNGYSPEDAITENENYAFDGEFLDQ